MTFSWAKSVILIDNALSDDYLPGQARKQIPVLYPIYAVQCIKRQQDTLDTGANSMPKVLHDLCPESKGLAILRRLCKRINARLIGQETLPCFMGQISAVDHLCDVWAGLLVGCMGCLPQ